MRRGYSVAIALLLSSVIAARTALAEDSIKSQPTPPMAVITLQGHPSQPEWSKICSEPKLDQAPTCYVSRDFVDGDGKPVMAVAWYEIGSSRIKRMARFLLPLGLSLESGVRVAIDDESPFAGTYTSCSAMGCFAEAGINDAQFQKIKNANKIVVGAMTIAKSELVFVLPANGIEKTFDGPALDPHILQERQDKLKRQIHSQ